MHYQEKVTEFMKTFGQDCPDTPTIPDLKTRILRVKLLLEEILELTEASGLKIVDSLGFEFSKSLLSAKDGVDVVEDITKVVNLTEIADAIADISYVNYGAASAYGINIAPIEDEVHSSNMTKLFTKDETLKLNAQDFTFKTVNDKEKCVLVKNKDGKVQKSPSYVPANVDRLVYNQLYNN
jgi:predicted HAD superfamily Cof-like phosphohydrolase